MPHKRKSLNISGPNLWYLVGLITTDGCLSRDGRHIDITSSNYGFLEGIKRLIGIKNKIGAKYGCKRQKSYYHIQLTNKNFYKLLLFLGLKPRKSLTLGKMRIPELYFCDFLRGVIDGDGGIQRWIHRTNKREQWNLRIASGSVDFLRWLQNKIRYIIGVKGGLYVEGSTQARLKYGKMAARKILEKIYYKKAFGLDRKIRLAHNCINSYIGWSQSKTILHGEV